MKTCRPSTPSADILARVPAGSNASSLDVLRGEKLQGSEPNLGSAGPKRLLSQPACRGPRQDVDRVEEAAEHVTTVLPC